MGEYIHGGHAQASSGIPPSSTHNYPLMVVAGSAGTSDVRAGLMATYAPDSGWAGTAVNVAATPVDIDCSNLEYQVATAPGGATSRELYLQDDGANSGLSVTLTGSTTYGGDTDTVTVAAGSEVDMAMDVTGAVGSSAQHRWSMDMWSANQVLLSASGASLSTSAARYMPLMGVGILGASAVIAEQLIPVPGKLKNLRLRLPTNHPGAGSRAYTVELMVNDVATALAATLSTGMQDATNVADEVTVAAGDRVYWRVTPTSSPSALPIGIGVEFVADTPGTFILMMACNTNTNMTSTCYSWMGGRGWTTTEVVATAIAKAFTLTDLRVLISALPGNSKTRDFNIVKNSVASAATVQFTGVDSNPNQAAWSGSVSVSAGDLISCQHVPTGASLTSGVAKWSLAGIAV